MSSTISNPVLYALMNSKVKKELVRMFAAAGLLCGRSRRRTARSASVSRAGGGGTSEAPSEWRQRRWHEEGARELPSVVTENARAVAASAAPFSAASLGGTDSACASASVAAPLTPESTRKVAGSGPMSTARPSLNGAPHAHTRAPVQECSSLQQCGAVAAANAALRTSHL